MAEEEGKFTGLLRPLSLEPTHVCVVSGGDCAEALDKTLQVLDACPTGYGAHQAYVSHDLVIFKVQISEAAGDGAATIQVIKLQGDTLAFIQFFVRFATKIKNIVELTPESEKHVMEFNMIIKSQGDHAPLFLADLDDVPDTLLPVTAMMTSEWSRSRMEGFKTVALLSDVPENARILEREACFVAALVGFEKNSSPTDFKNPDFIRVLARVLANVLTWHHEAGDPKRTIVYERLFERLVEIHEVHKANPMWCHARIELMRLVRIGISSRVT